MNMLEQRMLEEQLALGQPIKIKELTQLQRHLELIMRGLSLTAQFLMKVSTLRVTSIKRVSWKKITINQVSPHLITMRSHLRNLLFQRRVLSLEFRIRRHLTFNSHTY